MCLFSAFLMLLAQIKFLVTHFKSVEKLFNYWGIMGTEMPHFVEHSPQPFSFE